MSDYKEHINQYSAADIRRYLQGKLSAAEMHAMEKAALDDPFLSDAIEGMSQAMQEHDEPAITAHLKDLHTQVAAKAGTGTKTAPVRSFRWWQAAAAAVVLITATVWVYNTLLKPSTIENSLAVTKKETTAGNTKQHSTQEETATVNTPPVTRDSVVVQKNTVPTGKPIAAKEKNAQDLPVTSQPVA